MQPYFFPYIGYFQLLKSVDKFVFYDDVNYIKGGWINRNRLFLSGAIRYITVPLVHASSFKKINETQIKKDESWKLKIISSIDQSYSKSPFYTPVRLLIDKVLGENSENLAALAKHSIKATAEYIGINDSFIDSSAIYKNQEKNGAKRLIDICKIEKANEYWNLPGGRALYSAGMFKKHQIDLKFANVSMDKYQQNNGVFCPGLSIIDVLMHNEPECVLQMLNVGEQSEPMAQHS